MHGSAVCKPLVIAALAASLAAAAFFDGGSDEPDRWVERHGDIGALGKRGRQRHEQQRNLERVAAENRRLMNTFRMGKRRDGNTRNRFLASVWG